MTPGRERLLVAALLAVYVSLAVSSLRQKSATFDEGAHLPAGHTYWALGDFRLNPEHPPLVKLLAAAPLQLLPVTVRTDDVTWETRRQWEFGRRFLYHWNDADRLLTYGRLPIVALGALLALAVYGWTRSHHGPVAAVLAMGFCVLSPDVLAHGQIVTTDVGIALFALLAVASLWAMRNGITARRTLALAASCAAAAATKYSALLLVPILSVLALVLAARVPRRNVAKAAGVVAAIVLVVFAGLWACYGFRYAASPGAATSFEWRNVESSGPVVGAALAARDHRLLPEALLYGFLRFYKAQETRPAFLMGEVSEDGWWYYFPVTLAVKTPLPLLILVAVAAWTLRPGRLTAAERTREAFLWIPPVLYLAMVMSRSLNIGHRHLLPMYPYLFLLAGRTAAAGLVHPAQWVRMAVGVLLVWDATGTLGGHPHYLAYFNELAGGPSRGHRWLVDSNLDWGQDLKGLKTWMDRNRVPEISLSYFGTGDPEYYGIRCRRLPGHLRPPRVATVIRRGDWVAISATNLQAVYLQGDVRALMERFRGEPPVAQIGHSILVYRAGFDYDLPPEPLY